MNICTVAKATRGLATWLLDKNLHAGCAVAWGSRQQSEEFAQVTAAVLAEAGIAVGMFRELTPTPMLSYAVRHFECDGGVVITASHNSAEYNGYKVYGQDGCQIVDEDIKAIPDRIGCQKDLERIPDFSAFLQMEKFFPLRPVLKGLVMSGYSPSPKIGGWKALVKMDYLLDYTGLPASNALAFELEGDWRVVVRPSGTEPKLKLYLSCCFNQKGGSSDRLTALEQAILQER